MPHVHGFLNVTTKKSQNMGSGKHSIALWSAARGPNRGKHTAVGAARFSHAGILASPTEGQEKR